MLLLVVVGLIRLIAERAREGLAASRARGRVGVRPPVMTSDKLTAARVMLRDEASISTAARVIGVSRATLYRHLHQRAGEPVTA